MAASPPRPIKVANIITRTPHYERFTMSGAGYIRYDRPLPRPQRPGRGLRAPRPHDLGGAGWRGLRCAFCASFLEQTKKERGATSGLIHKAAVQISLVSA
jgi:hypothetical protein